MKKCENCGLVLQDNDSFCPNCGGAAVECAAENANVQPEQPEQTEQSAPTGGGKKGKSKKGLVAAIIAAVVAVLGVGAALVYMLVLNTPSKQFLAAQGKMFKNEWSREDTIETVLKGEAEPVKKDFSSDLSVSVDTNNDDINTIFNKLSFDCKVKIEGEDYLLDGALGYDGSPLLSCVLTADKDSVGFYAPELSDKYYVGSKALFEELLSTGIEPEHAPLEYTEVDSLEKAYKNIAKRYGKILLDGIADEDVAVEKNVNVTLELLETELSGCKVYTYTPDEARIAAMLKAFGEEMREDEELFNYFCSLVKYYFGEDELKLFLDSAESYIYNVEVIWPVLDSTMVITDDPELYELLSDSETWQEKQATAARNIIKNADTMAKAFVARGFEIKTAVHKGSVVMQTVTVSRSTVHAEMLSSKDEYRFAIRAADGSGENAETVVKGLLKRADGAIDGTVEIKEDSAVYVIELEGLSADKRSALGIPYGTMRISFDSESLLDGTMVVELSSAAAENGGTEHVIRLELPDEIAPSLEDLGLSDALTEISIHLFSSDKASTAKAPEAAPFEVATESDIEAAQQELSDELVNIILELAFSEMM